MALPRPSPDPTPYGVELAEHVAQRLLDGGTVYYTHRDYCGMGLWYEHGHFCYDEINDCGPWPWPAVQERGQVFSTRQAFVEWLAAQSDHSLAGFEHANEWLHQNQRITRDRLLREL